VCCGEEVPAAKGFLYQGPSPRPAPLRSAKAKSSPHFSTLFFSDVRRGEIVAQKISYLAETSVEHIAD
jgi:hypothetical protein